MNLLRTFIEARIYLSLAKADRAASDDD